MRPRPMMLALLGGLVLSGAGTADAQSGIQIVTHHPRIFMGPDDLPRVRARVGIVDGTNQTDYAGEWGLYAGEYSSLLNEVADYSPGLEFGSWNLPDARKYTRWFGNLAFAFVLNEHRPEGEVYKNLLVTLWGEVLQDSRDRNGGSIGESMEFNEWGKNANWKGFCIAYDYLFNVLSTENPSLRDQIAQWIRAQIDGGYGYIGGRNSTPLEGIEHYYKWPWCADGVWAGLLTIYGDPGIDQADVASMVDWTRAFKQYDNEARDQNYCGTYSGYRPERIEEDVCTAMAWKSATNEDPFVEWAYHYLNLDDWVAYMIRPNFHESDETGHSHDLAFISNKWVHFAYPSAVREANPYTLWFLDRARQEVGTYSHPWVNILFDDKTLPRTQPTLHSYPLARYFGDLTPEDGYNSQYAHFRSSWNYDRNDLSTVHASYFCGPLTVGHDLLSQGHFALFRGQDMLTVSTGVYDGTSFDHTRNWHQAPISENTILVADPDNLNRTSALQGVYSDEGMQSRAPNTSGGHDMNTAEEAYSYKFAAGFITRFATLDDGDAYLYSDFTHAYPNTQKPDLWTSYQTVENVTRQLTFQSGKYFVIVDRVTSVNASAKKRVLVHIPDKRGFELVDGDWTGGVAPHSVQYGGTPGQWSDDALRYRWTVGNSRAYASVLYPAPASMGGPGRNLVRVGGTNSAGDWNRGKYRENIDGAWQSFEDADPSFDYWLRETGATYRWVDVYISSGERYEYMELGWAGFWRMEIEATGQREHTFLHVYEVTDAAQASPVPVNYLAEVDLGHVGCSIEEPTGRRVNVYSRDEEIDTGAQYRTSVDGPIRHLVADLAPGVYLVEELDSGWHVNVDVAPQANVAAFVSPFGGRFRIERVPDVASASR